jgi:AcrR family transcriptional regulator
VVGTPHRIELPARERILDAVAAILVREGGDAVTISAVAREARVSKGGLFYHFPSKESLIEGLVDRFVSSFERLLASAGPERGAATRAYLRSAMSPGDGAADGAIALLGAVSVNPAGLDVLRERYRQWSDRLSNDGVPDWLADLVRFSVDGLWLAEFLDLAPVRGVRRAHLITNLDRMLSGALDDGVAVAPLEAEDGRR